MKKERVIASKKTETIEKSKTVINLGEDLPIFSAVSNIDLENLNLLITANIKDLLAPLTPIVWTENQTLIMIFLILYMTKI